MKRKRTLSLLLCLCLALTLLPTTALAADAVVQYLVINGTESAPTCTYQSPNTADGANGVLITGGDTAYTLDSNWNGYIIVNNASVTYNGSAGDFYVLGSGKLAMAEGAVEVTRGSYEETYSGDTGDKLLAFIGNIPENGKKYAYDFKDNYDIVGCLDAYDVTVAAEKTLTVKYDTNTTGDNPSNPDEHQSILRVTHSLTVNGTLAADADQRLEIGENATVSGVTLYDDDGEREYQLQSEHLSESFAYTNTASEGQTPVWRWVHQANSGGGEGGGEGSGEPQSAPSVSFRVQNNAAAVGTVQYKIGSGSWTNVTLTLAGESANQYLSGTITDKLAQNDTIYIKATPETGYEMDSIRGVAVWVDSSRSAITNGAEAIITDSGLSYPLAENKNYEFEFGFQTTGDPGGSNNPDPPSGTTYTITASAGANGSIVHYADNEPLTGNATVHDGDDCFFDMIPAPGYVVKSITIDGNEPLTGPFSSGTERYEFQGVRENHTISATFAEYVPEAHSNDPKTLIDRKEFAYSGANAAAIKIKFVDELWYTVFSGNTQQGAITTKERLAAAITLGNEVSNTTVRANGTSCSFTVELGDNDATGVIYTLNDEHDFVVRTTKDGTNSYTVVPYVAQQESAYAVIKDFDENGLYIFGNGTFRAPLETSGSGISAGHILNIGTPTLTQIGCQLVVYKPGFTGAKMQGVGEDNYASAWGFAQFPVVGTGGTTQAAPAETELYFGNRSVTLSKPETPDLGVAGIASVDSLLPTGAVTITQNNGAFNIAFNSSFYDEVKLKITYSLSDGGTREEFLTIRRVGIEVVGYEKHGDNSISTNHGTDPGYKNMDFWSGSNDDYAVFGTYYHPTVAGSSTQNSIQLYATYTWKNGTVTTGLLSSVKHLDANNLGNNVATDDFVLYKGTESSAPAKIEVTAVKAGGSETEFAGATLGSGAGVEWVYAARED